MRISSKLTLGVAIFTGMILGACATQDTNPYYKQSSKYPSQVPSQNTSGQHTSGQQSPTISYASAPTSSTNYVTAAGYPAPAGTVFADSATSTSGYVQPAQTRIYGDVQDYGPTYSYAQPATTYVQPATTYAQPVPAPVQSVMVETGGQNAGFGGQLMQPHVTYSPQTYAAAPYAQHTQAATHGATQWATQGATTQNAIATMPAFSPVNPAPISGSTSTSTFSSGAANGINYIVQENDTVYSLSRKTCSSVAQVQQMNGLDDSFLIKAGGTLRLPASNC